MTKLSTMKPFAPGDIFLGCTYLNHPTDDHAGEGRILQLQELLRSAKVGEAPVSDGVAGPGMLVEVRFDGDDEVETFLIGSREESETAGVEVYSSASPLGKALTGAREGDTVEYETPTGKIMKVTLVSAKPFAG